MFTVLFLTLATLALGSPSGKAVSEDELMEQENDQTYFNILCKFQLSRQYL